MIAISARKVYNIYVIKNKEVVRLNVRERILSLRLLEKQKLKPELAKQLGIDIKMVEKSKEKKKL